MEAKTSVIDVKEASRKHEEENIGLVEKVSWNGIQGYYYIF